MPLTLFINNNSTFQNKTTNAISVLVICSIISNYDCADNVCCDAPPRAPSYITHPYTISK